MELVPSVTRGVDPVVAGRLAPGVGEGVGPVVAGGAGPILQVEMILYLQM